MSGSSPSDPVPRDEGQLRAHSDPGVEIIVLNGELRRVARGGGFLGLTLPRGLYTVQFRVGAQVVERHVALAPGETQDVRVDAGLPFASAAPLPGTSTSREDHRHHARELSRSAPLDLGRGSGGRGSGLLVFVRDLQPRDTPAREGHPAQGLTLLDAAGNGLVDLGAQATRSTDAGRAAWAGVHLSLPPGTSRLRWQPPPGEPGRPALEQSVTTCAGWQTQVFLARQPREARPDQTRAAMLMAPLGQGFDGDRWELRGSETARIALERRRPAVAESVLRPLLDGGFEDPLGSVLGVHLLLQQPSPDPERLGRAVRRLQDLLGDHPDVQALALHVFGERPARPFTLPPMLSGSWRLVVAATAGDAGLVPGDSLAARVADRTFGDGAWLVWLVPDGQATPSSPATDPADLIASLARLRLAPTPATLPTLTERLSAQLGLRPLERGVLEQCLRELVDDGGERSVHAASDRALAGVGEPAPEPLSPARLVPTLHAPRSAIETAWAGVAAKLTATQDLPP